jgi:cobalt-zinc-cadmium efflux system protein
MGRGRPWHRMALAVGACLLTACAPQLDPDRTPPSRDATEREQAQYRFALLQQIYGGPYLIDPGLNAYVNGVGARVRAAAGLPRGGEFVVLNHWHPEAWALPDGQVAISVGLIAHLTNEAELAAVLARTLALASASSRVPLESASVPLPALAAPGAPRDRQVRSVVGAARESLEWLAMQPADDGGSADEQAMRWLARAGYDPLAMLTVRERLSGLAAGGGSAFASRLLIALPALTRDRQAALERVAIALQGPRELGEARFAGAMWYLANRAEALRLAVLAEQAVARAELDLAATLVQAALAIEPADPWLHGLRADVAAQRGEIVNALVAYQRAEILAALVNAVVLIAISGWILFEAARRLTDPPEIIGGGMLAVAIAALGVNAAALTILWRSRGQTLNVAAAFRHVLADLLSSLGVIGAALVILLTGWLYADPLISIGIAALILASAVPILRDAVRVLLEAAPRGIDAAEVGRAMAASEGVVEVHDLHIWTITSGFPALSAHVLVGRHEDCHSRRRELEELLTHEYGISHTTLQVDHVGEHEGEMYGSRFLPLGEKPGRW